MHSMVSACLVTRDITLKTELALSTKLLVLLISAAKLGIGIIKSVLNALKDGSSMLMVFVFQLMTSVLPMTNLVLALNATKPIALSMELV